MTRIDVQNVAAAGAAKADYSGRHPARFFTRAAMGGAFIAIGALLSVLCGAWFYTDAPGVARLLSSVVFSTALILIVGFGAELFTGLAFVTGVALYEKTVSPLAIGRILLLGYVGNFVGILIFMALLSGSGASGELLGAYLSITVPAKLAAPGYIAFLRAVVCNFLVCIGVFAGFRMKGEVAKMIVITLAVTAFCLAGLEHSVANMAFFSLHALLTGSANWSALGAHMLWVTLGNFVGGFVALALPVWLSAEPKDV